MDKDTLEASRELVHGVGIMVQEYLFDFPKYRDKYDMIEALDDAIQEIESWKKEGKNE